jgi:hypothetical protein
MRQVSELLVNASPASQPWPNKLYGQRTSAFPPGSCAVVASEKVVSECVLGPTTIEEVRLEQVQPVEVQ